MRVTIVVDDNLVVVDGIAQAVDCSPLTMSGTHAVQWYGSAGEVEYKTDPATDERPPNKTITDFSTYQPFVDLWTREARSTRLLNNFDMGQTITQLLES